MGFHAFLQGSTWTQDRVGERRGSPHHFTWFGAQVLLVVCSMRPRVFRVVEHRKLILITPSAVLSKLTAMSRAVVESAYQLLG